MRCGPARHKGDMTNQQLYLAIGVPMLFNAALFGVLFASLRAGFAAIDKRFDEMRDARLMEERRA